MMFLATVVNVARPLLRVIVSLCVLMLDANESRAKEVAPGSFSVYLRIVVRDCNRHSSRLFLTGYK